MPDGLYEHDALAWAEQQADLLRRLAAGERVDEAVDWSHVIEEINDVGLSQLRACQSALRLAMLHLLKLHAWPASLATKKWVIETTGFLVQAQADFLPSTRQRIDLTRLYGAALQQLAVEADDSGPPRPVPAACPLSLDDLIALPAIPDLLARLGAAQSSVTVSGT